MDEKDFYEIYESLGIKANKLDNNYTPDAYGESLMRDFDFGEEISYSASTEIVQNHVRESEVLYG